MTDNSRVNSTVPAAWNVLPFDDCVVAPPTGRRSVQQNSYRPVGTIPVVDQGRSFIAGYTNDDSLAYQDHELPLIVFGDHTRILKFIDFPFAAGADGTKVIAADPSKVDPRFFFYALLNLKLPSRGYNRHFRLLREATIAVPSSPDEQRVITSILSTIQEAVALEDRRVATLKELKVATMAEVFRAGLRGESPRVTAIGEIPKSWEVVPLGEILRSAQYGLSVRGDKVGGVPILRMNCQQDGRVLFRDLQYVDLDQPTWEAFRLKEGDLLFNRTNSFELVGRTALYSGNRDAVFASYLIRLRVNDGSVIPGFVNYYLNLESVQRAIKSLATRGVSQSNISASKLKTFLVPRPSLPEQSEVVKIIAAIDEAIQICERHAGILREMFEVALNQLMLGQLRVTPLLEQITAIHA